jgi:hypothetical protein
LIGNALGIYKFMKPVEPVLVINVLDPDSSGSVDPDPDGESGSRQAKTIPKKEEISC